LNFWGANPKIATEGKKGTTHDFFLPFNASLYLRYIALAIVVYRVDLVLPEDGERLLRRQLSRAKTVSDCRPSHGGDSGPQKITPGNMGSRRKRLLRICVKMEKGRSVRWSVAVAKQEKWS